jgi:Ca2+-binding RTX toxin-like protein
MLTVNPSLLTTSAANARFTVSFSLSSQAQTSLAGGVDSYKIRIDMGGGAASIQPASIKVLGDTTSGALYSFDPDALTQGIFSVAALAPVNQKLNALQPFISFEVNQTQLAPVSFTVKELTVNNSNFLAGVTNTSLPVSFGITIDRAVSSSAGNQMLYEAGGNLVIAPLGFSAGKTLLNGSYTPLKQIDGTNFGQDIISGFSPSSIGTYLGQYRVVFKSDNPLANGSFGFKTLDFSQATGVALAATPVGLASADGSSGSSGGVITNPLNPVLVTGSNALSYLQYKDLLPGVTQQDTVTQQKIGENFLLEFSLPDGTPYTKLVGQASAGINASIAQSPIALDLGLPAGLGASMFGPAATLTPVDTGKYFNSLVDLAFPVANDYSRSIKAAVDALGAKKSSSSQAKLLSPEGVSQGGSIQLAGAAGPSEFLVLNMWASSGIQTVDLSNLEHVLVVGDGTVTQAAASPVFLVGDGANQILAGGPGNDYLYSGGGSDVLIGGAGSDTFHITRKGKVTIQDFTSQDKLQFSFLGVNSLLDLVNRITGVDEQPGSVSYIFDSELVLTLIGYSLYDPYPESMFILS